LFQGDGCSLANKFNLTSVCVTVYGKLALLGVIIGTESYQRLKIAFSKTGIYQTLLSWARDGLDIFPLCTTLQLLMPLYENATVGNADALHQQLSFRYNSVNESSSSDSGCLCGCQNPTPIPFYLVVNGDWKYNCIIHGHKGGLSKDFCILCNITTKTRNHYRTSFQQRLTFSEAVAGTKKPSLFPFLRPVSMPPDLTHMNIRIPNRLLCFTISILFRYSTGINLVSTLIVFFIIFFSQYS